MKIYLVTGNRHKFREIKELMDRNRIEIEQIDLDKPEEKSDDIKEIAETAAKRLADEFKKPVMVDDTGIYFTAWNNFPGPHPKFVWNSLGYEGMLKLLEGKERAAYFMTVAAYCEPGKEPVSFEGRCKGRIIDEIRCKDKDVQPYERIFVPEGYDKVWAEIPEIKAGLSHRVSAFQQLADHLKKNIQEKTRRGDDDGA
ncbi:non-canonical purine NTP pyrophosphatase [Candidatus Woesearchaeota archaeon]|nr:non-canonical purine NTP pyrophosphatase [Candidatus Woesearchaeota archaeon]